MSRLSIAGLLAVMPVIGSRVIIINVKCQFSRLHLEARNLSKFEEEKKPNHLVSLEGTVHIRHPRR